MDNSQILKQLQDIFCNVFKNNDLHVDKTTSMDNLDSWDSLSHVVLIDSIEKHFCLKFELRDMLDIESVADIIELIQRKTKS